MLLFCTLYKFLKIANVHVAQKEPEFTDWWIFGGCFCAGSVEMCALLQLVFLALKFSQFSFSLSVSQLSLLWSAQVWAQRWWHWQWCSGRSQHKEGWVCGRCEPGRAGWKPSPCDTAPNREYSRQWPLPERLPAEIHPEENPREGTHRQPRGWFSAWA